MPNASHPPTDQEILAARPQRNAVRADRPYAFLVEPERTDDGRIVDVATVFLTNRECPFRCVMCDLWKNTTVDKVPPGAIPQQIDYALSRLRSATQIKLYNSGNFFDRQAIPREDYAAIAERVRSFERVIVENHPRLCGPDCAEFAGLLAGRLEVALGLETAHPETLRALNKQMTLDDFSRTVERLLAAEIAVRAFILLQPPFLPNSLAEEWALRSLEYAFALGVSCCTVIPTRGGNGIMESLADAGRFSPPSLAAVERVMERGLNLKTGRVFVDLWDAARLASCPCCASARIERLRQMNLAQRILPSVPCSQGVPA